MQKIKAVQIGGRSFTIKELPMRPIWDLLNNNRSDEQSSGLFGRGHELMAMACPELSKEVLLDLYPSEIEELWAAFEEVNSAFLAMVRRVGIDRALVEAIVGTIRTSIGQSVSSSLAVTGQ